MQGLKFILVAGVASVTLSACADLYKDASNAEPTGSSFTRELYKGYVGLAGDERAEQDWTDSDLFANKALAAADGNAVAPEELANWDLDAAFIDELGSARGRLMNALNNGAADQAPTSAAHAQVMFDCWIQEQEENIQPDHIAGCRDGFLAAMEKVDAALAPKAAAPAPAPAPVAMPDPYFIYFDFNSADLTDDAQVETSVIAATIQKLSPSKVIVAGHADTSGDADYNQTLAGKRAAAVAAALTGHGVSADHIQSHVLGENAPAVNTGDGVAEVKNRRVVVTLVK
ncbi:OmpA family protein [Kiloniella laminariae]|uniref:OmpA family protein n=1 Tax=Kiloniella laminariae TaxID=454162 RepID=A0ABT4LLG0_9PROT|nr:OmpA family protein [Kiloniella laminariae]MCZ4281909.1 OmpA family protein [Kiloniella laminariae]